MKKYITSFFLLFLIIVLNWTTVLELIYSYKNYISIMKFVYNFENINTIAESKKGCCISTEFIKYNEKMIFECSENHTFSKKPVDVVAGKWCPKCVKYISEEICKYVLENMLGIKFEKYYFSYKGHNGLEIDGFNKEYNIAFEYNGKQHYELTSFIKTEEELTYRKYLDSIKEEYCKNNNINLITIPYTVKNKDILYFIKNELESKYISIKNENIDVKKFIANYSYYKNRKQKITEMIESKNGKLLDFDFNSVKIECKNGHVWETIYYIIKSGHWCMQCSFLRITYEEMLDRIEGYIICLSPKEEYFNSESLLKFECKNGHTFINSAEKIFRDIKDKNRKICKKCLCDKQNKVIAEIEKTGLFLKNLEIYKHKRQDVEWVCKNGHVFIDKLSNVLDRARRGTKMCHCLT